MSIPPKNNSDIFYKRLPIQRAIPAVFAHLTKNYFTRNAARNDAVLSWFSCGKISKPSKKPEEIAAAINPAANGKPTKNNRGGEEVAAPFPFYSGKQLVLFKGTLSCYT